MACAHLDAMTLDVPASGHGCVECLATGGHWLHLRRCLECGHIGCCDNSPGRHATAHYHAESHPLVQSYEPGEDWVYCYVDDLAVDPGGPPSPSHR